MKQKIVIMVLMNDDKCRRKAMKIAVCVPGVESAAITGEERNQVEVVGNEVDSVELTRRLRKNVAHAHLVSVAEVKKDDDSSQKILDGTVAVALAPPFYGFPNYCYCEEREPNCSIL